jgi:hypothetical protein
MTSVENVEYYKLGKDLDLKSLLLQLPKIEKYKVSIKMRSDPNGFLQQFISQDGNLLSLSDDLLTKRHLFLQRTMGAYRKPNGATWRRFLSLIAWGFEPDKKATPPVQQKRGRKPKDQPIVLK